MNSKYIFIFVLVFFSFTFNAFSQEKTISAEKKKLIAEIIIATKADQGVKEMMQAAFKQMGENYPILVQSMLEKRTDLTSAQKKEVADMLISRNANERSFQNRLIAAINFQEYVELSFNTLYDKFFTESELNDLLAFYKSPTGQKLNDIMPQLATESVKLAQEFLLPKILETVDRQITSDIENQKKTVAKPKK